MVRSLSSSSSVWIAQKLSTGAVDDRVGSLGENRLDHNLIISVTGCSPLHPSLLNQPLFFQFFSLLWDELHSHRLINHLSYTLISLPGLPADVAHFLSCGADRVLLKPLDILAFGEAMRDVRVQQQELQLELPKELRII